jgi:siroheme synthase-like protein
MKGIGASSYYPASLNIHGKRCVVIGGGEVALRKARALLDCGAKVTVVSPTLHPDLAKLGEARRIRPIHREFQPEDLADASIAIAATDVKEVNQRVADAGREQGVFVNVVDDSERSDFIVPSFFRRGGLTIAVSTSGMSPALARKIRTRLEGIFGREFGRLLSMIKDVRSELKGQGIAVSADAWQEALDVDLLVGLVRAGQSEEARTLLRSRLEAHRGER